MQPSQALLLSCPAWVANPQSKHNRNTCTFFLLSVKDTVKLSSRLQLNLVYYLSKLSVNFNAPIISANLCCGTNHKCGFILLFSTSSVVNDFLRAPDITWNVRYYTKITLNTSKFSCFRAHEIFTRRNQAGNVSVLC